MTTAARAAAAAAAAERAPGPAATATRVAGGAPAPRGKRLARALLADDPAAVPTDEGLDMFR